MMSSPSCWEHEEQIVSSSSEAALLLLRHAILSPLGVLSYIEKYWLYLKFFSPQKLCFQLLESGQRGLATPGMEVQLQGTECTSDVLGCDMKLLSCCTFYI